MRERFWLDIAHLLHIPPWDLSRLTYEELEQACALVDKAARQATKSR